MTEKEVVMRGLRGTGNILAVLLCLILMAAGCGRETYRRITMDEAKELIERGGDFLVVDVRTKEEYDKGHIPGAILFPIEEIKKLDFSVLPDKNKPIMVYCWTGRRSEDSAVILSENGYRHVYDIGGFVDWEGEKELSAAGEETNP